MRTTETTAGLCLLITAAFVLSTTAAVGASDFEMPKLYDKETIDQYRAVQDSAYEFLERDDYEKAVSYFERQMELVPEAVWPAYNLACAFSLKSDIDAAVMWLGKSIELGMDSPDQLEADSDLKNLRQDDRFAALLAKAEENSKVTEKVYAAGLKRYDQPPVTFEDEETLTAWVQDQESTVRANGRAYPGWKRAIINLDMESKRLAAEEQLKGDEFDYEFERILVLTGIRSIWEDNWGELCEAIEREVSDYLKANPEGDKTAEVRYRGGLAALLNCGMDNTEHESWSDNVARARGYLAAVNEESDYYGAAQGLILASSLAKAGDNRASLINEVKAFHTSFSKDKKASRIGKVFFAEDMVNAAWPIPLTGTDVNGQAISLEQFKGKFVMLDFWAIWCGPCRAEIPHLVEAYNKYKDAGVEFLSVSLDYADRHTTEDLVAWANEKGMTWNHVYDGDAWDSEYPNSFMVASIPSPFLIGPNGELVARGEDLRGENLDKTISEALLGQ